jgi:GT2 family glycosyltransferase
MIISFIIPTFNRATLLERLLDSIGSLRVPDGVEVRTVVVNDGSSDRTAQLLRDCPQKPWIVDGDGNWWWTRCINEGMRQAAAKGSSHFIWMNDDNELPIDYLEVLVRDYRTLQPDSILGSASLSVAHPRRIDACGYGRYNRLANKMHSHFPIGSVPGSDFHGVRPTWSLSGRGTLVPKTVLDRVGYLDSRLLQYGSDDDYILSARRKGVSSFISLDAQVLNRSDLTSSERNIQTTTLYSFIRSLFLPHTSKSLSKQWIFYSKHGVRVLTPLYVFYIGTSDIASFILKKIRGSFRGKSH